MASQAKASIGYQSQVTPQDCHTQQVSRPWKNVWLGRNTSWQLTWEGLNSYDKSWATLSLERESCTAIAFLLQFHRTSNIQLWCLDCRDFLGPRGMYELVRAFACSHCVSLWPRCGSLWLAPNVKLHSFDTLSKLKNALVFIKFR